MSLRVYLSLRKRATNYGVRRSQGTYMYAYTSVNTTGIRWPLAQHSPTYVYTTYLEEFAGVLACICLTALTDPDPNISLEELSVLLALPAQRAFVLSTNSRKTNPEFCDLPRKWNANILCKLSIFRRQCEQNCFVRFKHRRMTLSHNNSDIKNLWTIYVT